ncbi:DnaB Replicative DNA helicase [uncultured Caudovirales phage]|uniref:DNA 5'-3' helicase n=1 Tax=uncultured Caudovirales phage TaxID=2100421 RepID=A0A6J5M4X5_9CAUD|nr:DnaB Replicative DNA helicase [uncultured Caudovirales phage]
MSYFEQSVIGSVLLTNGRALENLTLSPKDFDDLQHERIYQTMLEMKSNRQPIDVITVGAALPKLASYLHDIITATPTPASVGFYANKVIEEATRRRLAIAGTMIHSKAQHEDLATVFDTAKKEIDDLIDRNQAVKPTYVADELLPYMDELDKPKAYPVSPWPSLNEIIAGFRPGALYIIGARPGVGKTIVGLQIAWELSKTGPVSFHSLEMGRNELYNRIIASEAQVYIGNIEKGTLKEHDWLKIANVRQKIQSHQLAIHDKSGQNLLQIRALANSVKGTGDLKAIVVDYLGLIQDTERGRKRYEMITDISIGLKNLARDLNVPVIALAQLNRGPEQRKDSEPDLADLRDSGGIEQDADAVILLHRVSIAEDQYDWQKSWMVMKVAKNRHGALGQVGLKFEGHLSRVVEG